MKLQGLFKIARTKVVFLTITGRQRSSASVEDKTTASVMNDKSQRHDTKSPGVSTNHRLEKRL